MTRSGAASSSLSAFGVLLLLLKTTRPASAALLALARFTSLPTPPPAPRLKLGDAFIDCSEDYATEFCEKRQERLQAQMDAITAEETTILERQKALKKALYGRFGAAINLEE